MTYFGRIDCSGNNLADPTSVRGFTGVWDSDSFVFEPQRNGYLPLTGLSSWAVAEASCLNERGVIPTALKSRFQSPIRRDEFTALLVRIYEDTTDEIYWGSLPPFNDISDSFYQTAIRKAYYFRLIDGTSPTKFTPAGLLTREQTAKLLFTMVDEIDGAKLGNGTPDFTDNTKISPWAVPYVAYAQNNKLMQGKSGGNFDPKGNLTREEAMLVVERLIVQYDW